MPPWCLGGTKGGLSPVTAEKGRQREVPGVQDPCEAS